jgi:hypothetical protein
MEWIVKNFNLKYFKDFYNDIFKEWITHHLIEAEPQFEVGVSKIQRAGFKGVHTPIYSIWFELHLANANSLYSCWVKVA